MIASGLREGLAQGLRDLPAKAGEALERAVDSLFVDESLEGCTGINNTSCAGMAIRPSGIEMPMDDVPIRLIVYLRVFMGKLLEVCYSQSARPPRTTIQERTFKDGYREIVCPSLAKDGSCANTFYMGDGDKGTEIDVERTVVERLAGIFRNRCATCSRYREIQEEMGAEVWPV